MPVIDPDVPSFYAQILAARRAWYADRAVDVKDPSKTLLRKLNSYRLAEAHGASIPEVYGIWDDPAKIEWRRLPDRVVLKSDGGASSRGVFPLERRDDGYVLAGRDEPMSTDEVADRFRELAREGRIQYPVFAEEWLRPADGQAAIPQDVKLYTFYGEVGLILLRSADVHGAQASVRYRYLGRDGSDLGQVAPERRIDHAISPPSGLSRMIDVAEELSLATKRPFVRVDLYETTRGIVFGEFTPIPGGRQYYELGLDRTLGEMWEAAELRLAVDVRRSGAFDLAF